MPNFKEHNDNLQKPTSDNPRKPTTAKTTLIEIAQATKYTQTRLIQSIQTTTKKTKKNK